MPDDLQAVLDPAPVDQSVKADAWDAYQSAASPEDFQARFDKLALPEDTKADLWDLKFGGAVQRKPMAMSPTLDAGFPLAPMPVPPGLREPAPQTGYMGLPVAPYDADFGAAANAGLQNVKGLVTSAGPILEANPEFSGEPARIPTPEQEQAFSTAAEKSPVPLTEAYPKPGLMRGLAQGVEGGTSFKNLGMMAGIAGTAAIAPEVGLGAVAYRAINMGLSAYFTKEMVAGASDEVQQAYRAWKDKDYKGVAQHLGTGTIDGLFAAFGLHHVGESASSVYHTKIRLDRQRGAAAPEPPGPGLPPAPPQGLEGPQGLEAPEPEPPPKPSQVERVSPSTPNPPTAAIPTAPESLGTIAAQVAQLAGEKPQRRVVMIPKGSPAPDDYPPGTAVTHDAFGNVYIFRPDLIKRSEIHAAAKQNRLPEILGSTDLGMGAPDKSQLPPEAPVIVSRDTQGNEVQSTATNEETLPVTVAAAQQVTPPGGSVSIEPAEGVVAGRAPDQAGLTQLGGDMGRSVTDSMYRMLWDKVQAGDITESGAPSAVLQAAKLVRDRGGLQIPDEFRAFAQEYAQIPRDQNFQQSMRELVARHTPPEQLGTPAPIEKPVTPQIPSEPGTKYVLPSFVTAGQQKRPAAPPAQQATWLHDDFGNFSVPSGTQLFSRNGRPLAPSPSFDASTNRKRKLSLNRQREWLLAEAQREAAARGDAYMGDLISREKASNYPRATADMVNEYLFGQPDGPEAHNFTPTAEKPEPQPQEPGLAPPPGPRWTGDRGAIPDEPAYYLDSTDEDEGRAALVEVETPKGVLWEAVTRDGKSLGQFSFLEQAARAAEEAFPKTHEFASTQANLSGPVANAVRAFAQSIPDATLAEDGRETQPHVTVKYGLHTDDSGDVAKLLQNEPPIVATLGKMSLFQNEDADVLKIDVDSPDLHRLNKKIASLPHTDTHPEYTPHATIAYLKPGEGKIYDGLALPGVTGQQVTLNEITYSGKNREQIGIPLTGVAEPETLAAPQPIERPKKPVTPQIANEPGTKYVLPSFATGTKPPKAAPEQLAAPEPIEKPVAAEPEEQQPEARGAEALANEVYRHLANDEAIGNVTALNKLAEKAWGASRTSGVWTPKDAFDAMEVGINKFLAENGARLMKIDAVAGLKRLRHLMTLIPSQGVRTDEQIKKQQFSTPPTESYLAAKVAGLRPNDVVLEPSAGNGGLAVWPKSIGARTYVNEISERRREMLQFAGFENPTGVDGEVIHSLLDQKIKPTVILMNPPFSAGVVKSGPAKNRNVYGFNHVDSALQRLEPGGRLVAILGGGQANEPNGGASLTGGGSGDWFNKVGDRYTVRANVRISGKEYQKYGTSFATRIIVIDKTGPMPAHSTVSRWANVVQGNVDTLEEAYGLLQGVAESRPVSQTEAVQPRPGGQAGARPGEPGAGLGTGQNAGGERHPEPIQGERGAAQEGELPGRPPQPRGSAGADQPGARGEQPALREPETRPAKPAETAPAEHPASGAGDVDLKRPLGGGETVAPDGEEPLNLEPTKNEIERQDEDDQAVYVTYKPSIEGGAHPGDIVETATMATVPLPKITYKPNLPKDANLSAVQMEAVAIAGQQNAIVLPDGAYASALIGDGTGVGKGRISAAILYDNYRQGRKRLVWVSEKWDLMQDAVRDFDGLKITGPDDLMRGIKYEGGKYIFAPNAGVVPFRNYKTTDKLQHGGVVFTTYALVRSKDKKGNRRAAQLEQYLRGDDDGEGAYILFDESHNLKNAVVAQGGQVSQIGQAVKELLERMPKLRTTSLSATAATDVINLGYLDRLGLWGPGTAFPNGFGEFGSQVASGGMAAMELIAREMKSQGKYVSRTLSFKGVEYSEAEHKLSADQKELYRTAAKAWAAVIQRAEDTIRNTTNGGSFARGRFMALLAGAQQRFFNVLITTFKIPTAIELANKALDQDKSVVITLVNTNEAAQNREKNKARDEDADDEEPEYDFGPKEMLLDLIKQHYPTQQFVDDVDSAGNPVKRPLYQTDANGNEVPVQNPEAVAEQKALIAEINRDLHLPENPLDLLIQGLGGPNKVAELTGRKEYYDRSRGQFIPRGDPNVARKDINLYEMRAFQGGKKRIAILSGAAGTGISLHADKGAANKQRRYQITLQVGWSADKQMQMFGRTHRTNQVSAPEYVMLVSDLGGEKRFVSTIARRLGSLGALTKGQKNATSGTDLMEKVNFETEQGRRATDNFYTALLRGQTVPGTQLGGLEVLAALRVLRTDPGGGVTVAPEDRTNVTRLLNRLLALDPDIQNAVYNFFYDIFQATVQDAIENGTLDTGVRTLPGDEFELGQERTIAKDPATGAETKYTPVTAKIRTERVSVADMHKRLKQYDKAEVITSKGEVALRRPAPPIVHADGRLEPAVYVSKPGQGRWQKVSNDEAFIRNAKTINKWAKEESDRLANEVKSAQHNADYYRKQLQETTNRQRNELETKAARTITGLESRLTLLADELKPRTKAELVTARQDLENAKTYELPADNWLRNSLNTSEEKLARAQTEQAAADVIAKNPMDWADENWQEAYDKAPSHISQEHHFVTGAVLKYWNPIKEATFIRNSIYTASDTKSGKRVVGIDIPKEAIRPLLNRIEGGQSTVDYHQLSTDVLQNNLTYTLEGNIRVRRGRVGKENVIQLIPPSGDVGNTLQSLGVLYERGAVPVFYAPNNTNANQGATRMSVMKRVMEQFPVKEEKATQDVYLGAGLGALQPHLDKFVSEQLLPELKKGTRWATQVWDDILRTFAPQARGPLAKEGSGSLREMMGKLALQDARTHAAMEQFRSALQKLPAEHGVHALNVIDAIEGGDIAGIDDPVLRKFAETARQLYDDRKELLDKLGLVKHFLENYFTHMYKDPAQAEAWTGNWLSRRPMAGKEAFRKKRVYPTLREALEDPEFKLVAKFDNPVDFVYAGLSQMDKSIYAHEFFEEWREKGLLKFGRRAPAPGWEQIDDRLFTVYGPRRGAVKIEPREPKPEQFEDDEEYENAHHTWEQKMEAIDEGFIKPEDVEVIGQRVMGHYWAPSQLAQPIDNYLSPGLRGKAFFDAWMKLKGGWNALNLGFSAFHGLTTTLNASMNDFALGVKQALAGRPVKAAKSIGMSLVPFGSVTRDVRRGKYLEGIYKGEVENPDPMALAIVDALTSAGFRIEPDYSNWWKGLRKAWDEKRPAGVAMRALNPLLWSERSTMHIMRYLVPRAKIAAFERMMQFEIEQHPGMSAEEARERFGKIGDSIDDRLGQLNQNNLLMNAVARDLLNASVGRFGWNHGFLRTAMGGGYDVIQNIADIARGKPTEMSHRTAYVIAIVAFGAIINAITQFLLTGELAHGTDYLAPRDGGKNADGTPSRIILPLYLAKDLYSWATRPVMTLLAKLAQPLMTVGQLAQNRDFYSRKILGHGGIGLGQYALELVAPYAVSGARKNIERGESFVKTALPFVGVLPASPRTGQTKAQRIISEYRDDQRRNVRPAPTDRTRARNQVLSAAQHGDIDKARQLGREGVRGGALSPADVKAALTRAKEGSLFNDVHAINDLDVVMRVYDAADPDERKLIEREVRKKVTVARGQAYRWTPEARQLAQKYFHIVPRASYQSATPAPDLAAPAPLY